MAIREMAAVCELLSLHLDTVSKVFPQFVFQYLLVYVLSASELLLPLAIKFFLF